MCKKNSGHNIVRSTTPYSPPFLFADTNEFRIRYFSYTRPLEKILKNDTKEVNL